MLPTVYLDVLALSLELDLFKFYYKMSVSLENFNPKSTAKRPLDSPRSLEACRRQGIEPHELLAKT
jgi:hypothetical protein